MPTEENVIRVPESAPVERHALLVFGGGGHGRVVADAALASGTWSGLLASDRNPARCQEALLPGVPSYAAEVAARHEAKVHVAIGDNRSREREAQAWGLGRLVAVVHPRATVSPWATVGLGSFVAAQAVLAPGAWVGLGVIVNHGAVVDHDVAVGDFSHVAPHAALGGFVQIGARVLIGAGAVVLPGVRIDNDVIVGAGAVVCDDIEIPGIYVGVPARRVKG